MDAVRGLFGSKPQPELVDSDEIYQTTFLDNNDGIKQLVLTWTLRFNDVLDAEKLHDSLCRLLEIGDWKKLGGRLRPGRDGKLDLHVPTPFTAERPPVAYSHENFSIKIDDHSLASKLPKAGTRPSFVAQPEDFNEFAFAEDAPQTIDEYVAGEIPVLSLRITSFLDATLVALTWPHLLMDAKGQQALLRNWSLVLAGREAEVAPLLAAQKDLLHEAAGGDRSPEELGLEPQRLGALDMAKFGARFAADMFIWDRRIECRTIFFPRAFIESLRAEALKQLEDEKEDEKKETWVSEGDVIVAWLAQNMTRDKADGRPLLIGTAIDVRTRLPTVLEPKGTYINNLVMLSFTTATKETLRGPVGPLASAHRRCLKEQTRGPQVLASLQAIRANNYKQPIFGPSDSRLFIVTNWTKCDLISAADFGPAVIQRGQDDGERSIPPGMMSYHHSALRRQYLLTRNCLCVFGKDHDGNYWISGYLGVGSWESIGRGLSEAAENY